MTDADLKKIAQLWKTAEIVAKQMGDLVNNDIDAKLEAKQPVDPLQYLMAAVLLIRSMEDRLTHEKMPDSMKMYFLANKFLFNDMIASLDEEVH